MEIQLFNNTGKYCRLILRRDRISIVLWIFSIALITLIIPPAFTELYPTQLDRQVIAETMKNPAITAMLGPAYGIDDYTLGAIMAHQMLLFTAIAVAIMSILLVNRHTRGDEEEGRIEVIRSLPVGRLSNLSGTMLVLFGINIFLAIIIAFGLYALGIESIDLNGSLIYGGALGVTGMVFAAVTALFAQLTSTSRGTLGFSFAFLGVGYLVRGIGDVSSEALSWLTPLGWILRSEAYVNNYWWPILLTMAVAVAITVIALYLNSVRDLGAGFLPAKAGRKTASKFLLSPVGLGLKLQRVGIISWIIGIYVLGASYGSVLGDIEAYFQSSDMMRQMFSYGVGFSLVDQFITVLMSVIAMTSAVPVLLVILKLKGEEKSNRIEHLLATAVSRNRLLGSFLGISLVLGFIVQLFAAVGLWMAGSAVLDEALSFIRIFNASMVYLPAIWVMLGVAVFLIGCIPKGTLLAWLYLGYSFFVVYFGQLLQIPEWMIKLSPFGNVPQIPIEDMNFTKITLLTLIAVGLIGIGFVGYNKRDIHG